METKCALAVDSLQLADGWEVKVLDNGMAVLLHSVGAGNSWATYRQSIDPEQRIRLVRLLLSQPLGLRRA